VPASDSSSVLIRDIRGKKSSAATAPQGGAPATSYPPPVTAPTGASAPATSYSPLVTALRNVASLLEVGTGFHPELTGCARSAQRAELQTTGRLDAEYHGG
jgi:hypothetical protein